MFSQASVILSMGVGGGGGFGLCMMTLPVWLPNPTFPAGVSVPGPSHVPWEVREWVTVRGFSVKGGLCLGGIAVRC